MLDYRYIDIDENGRVEGSRTIPLETSIDTEGMVIPEQPTDAIYALYYNEEQGLHWVKVADFEEEPETPSDEDVWADMAKAIEEGVNDV